MTTGIVLAVLFLLLVGNKIVCKHIKNQNICTILRKTHKVLGVIFIVLTFLHLSLTITLFKQRPIGMYLLGSVMLLAGLLEFFLFLFRKKIKSSWIRYHRYFAILIMLCLCVHVLTGIVSLNVYKQKISLIEIQDVNMSDIKDGVYDGEYDADYVYAKVRVTVKDNNIISVDLLEHRTERGRKAETMPTAIVEQQKVDVDAVSGATNSSRVIEQAVYNALVK